MGLNKPQQYRMMQVFTSAQAAGQALGNCVATIGKYDGMHLGHQRILAELKRQAASLEVPSLVILSEPQPEEFFMPDEAPPRLNHFGDKVAWLETAGVDAVLRMDFDQALSQTPAEDFIREYLVQALGIRCLVVGDDFRFGKGRMGNLQLLTRMGEALGYSAHGVGACLVAEERVSSTLIRQYLQAGDCQQAARLLGRPYAISGEVIHGRKLGRELGVPTANVGLQVARLVMTGVFCVDCRIGDRTIPGVANMGFNPSVTSERVPSLEVHLLDFDGDVYGKQIQVSFLHKLRDEEKLPDLVSLQNRMMQDIANARQFFEAVNRNEQV
jgi:riboflavin kinase/FMN adenylyltransferase